ALLPLTLRRPDQTWVHTEHWSAFAARERALRAVVGAVGQLHRLPDGVVAVSSDLAGAISAVAHRDVAVVPNIVAGPLSPEPRPTPDVDLRMVAIGGLIERKDPATAVRMVAELVRRGVATRLTWVGE